MWNPSGGYMCPGRSSRSMTEFSCVPERIEKGWMSLFMFFRGKDESRRHEKSL